MCNKAQNSRQPNNITAECRTLLLPAENHPEHGPVFKTMPPYSHLPENATDASLEKEVLNFKEEEEGDASQSQTKGEPEGHFHGNLGDRVVEANVKLLRNGLQQHASESQRK